MRPSGRAHDQLRAVSLELDVARHAEGSCLVKFGDTHVLCVATVEERVPPFLRNSGKGWVTAEYGMLPRSTNTRSPREAARGKQSGRTQEIQRLIGRSLRAVTRLDALGERQVILDCDVLQADGGTRTASITGAYVALHHALSKLVESGALPKLPLREPVAAVSCGIVGGTALLDLDYVEDSGAQADANFVLSGSGGIVEVQVTAEDEPDGPRPVRGHADAGGQRNRIAGGASAPDAGMLTLGQRLLVATHNPGKLREFEYLLQPHGIEVVGAAALGLPEPEETGDSFHANAALKARAAVAATGLPALADDSGIVVHGLDGQPGIHSARWAGPERNFDLAIARVLEGLASRFGSFAAADHRASFVAVLCLTLPDGSERFFEGRSDGSLIDTPRGARGFGYDPIFVPDGETRAFAEMTAARKARDQPPPPSPGRILGGPCITLSKLAQDPHPRHIAPLMGP